MKPVARFLWFLIATGLVAVLVVLAVFFRRPAIAQAKTPIVSASKTEGVVCFGTVDLEHGVTSLFPLQPGRVAEVLVHENQEVPAGTDLIRLEDPAVRSRLAEAEAGLELGRLQLALAVKMPEQHRRRIDQQQAAQDAASSRLTAARQVHAFRQKMPQGTLAASIELATSDGHVCQMEAMERLEILRLAEMKAQDIDHEIRRAEHELAAAEARRDQARLALDECRIKAPRSGTVLRILVGPGDVLGLERVSPALLFAPDGPQVIRAAVEQEFASRIKVGDQARIEDDADPSINRRGRVERLAAWYSQRRAVVHDPSQMTDVRTLECAIVLEPEQPRMRLGQSVRVRIGRVPD